MAATNPTIDNDNNNSVAAELQTVAVSTIEQSHHSSTSKKSSKKSSKKMKAIECVRAAYNDAAHVAAALANGAPIDARDQFDNTPLIVAASRGDIPTATLLLEAKADIECEDEVVIYSNQSASRFNVFYCVCPTKIE
jgi:ankyrin repeat protein